MNPDRIKEIQETTAYPKSRSVRHALLQVWHECSQEKEKQVAGMTEQDKEQLKLEIDHIFESGANEIRIFEMVEAFIEKRFAKTEVKLPTVKQIQKECSNMQFNQNDYLEGANYVIECIKEQIK